jgi:predicted kinase
MRRQNQYPVSTDPTPAPLVLIITGAPASGKSTLGPRLASALGLPYLSKDFFKESLFETLGVGDKAWSQRLGVASIQLLFRSAAALLQAGQSLAVESNFVVRLSSPEFQALANRFGCRFIQVVCTASGPILRERFERRVVSGERHPGHADAETLDEWRAALVDNRWEALDLPGPVFSVDTEGNIQVEALVARIAAARALP